MKPQISYGFRGEGIKYEFGGKKLEIDFTWINGNRIYTETISRWNDGTELSETEKKNILTDILQFTKGWFRKSIVVINTDDPSLSLWKQVCSELSHLVKKVEYTSDEVNRQVERQMYVGILNSKGSLIINDVRIHDENQLDKVLATLRKTRS
jgi:hypothetical protein